MLGWVRDRGDLVGRREPAGGDQGARTVERGPLGVLRIDDSTRPSRRVRAVPFDAASANSRASATQQEGASVPRVFALDHNFPQPIVDVLGITTAFVAAGGSTVIATGTNVLVQGDLYVSEGAIDDALDLEQQLASNISTHLR